MSVSVPTATSASTTSTSQLLSSFTDPEYPPIPVDSYSVYIGHGILKQLHTVIKQLSPAAKYVLISDTNVFPLYGSSLISYFSAAGLCLLSYTIPPGESSKSRNVKAEIEDWLLSQQCGRDTTLLALGGGVIGDLTGFVAATYMRGIPYIQLPSSLLAMVDSSIGGKTGIDAPHGKNLIGAFWRPKAVIIDSTLLATLPRRELCNGMAESIKAGIIADAALFTYIENHADRLLAGDLTTLLHVIYHSVVMKASVVRADEREGGLRSILNFGHSIGHGIEALMQPTLLHGECVSIGMMEEAILARTLGLCTSATIRRLHNCVSAFKLPTHIPEQCTPSQIIEKMSVDKKNKGGKKEIVMLTGIGSVRTQPAYTTTMTDHQLYALMSKSITLIPSQSQPHGIVSVPGSKSLSNRILQLAALGRGSCKIRGLLHSQDTQVMLDSLRELGVKFTWQQEKQSEEVLTVIGSAGKLLTPHRPLFLNNAGTASRFLTTVATVIPEGECVLTGNARMQERPIADLVEALQHNGIRIEYLNKQGCLPIKLHSVGGFPGGTIHLRANISSQYVSSILLSAPHAFQPVTLHLDQSTSDKTNTAVVSKPFIDMTIDLMHKFHISVTEIQPYVYQVARGVYDNPAEFLVEGDASSATYPLALAAVSEGGSVTVQNVGSDSLQGDSQFYCVLQQMGCSVSQTPMTTTVTGPASLSALQAIDVDMDSMTDTFMTLAAVACFATGTTRITNIANQRVKECNRIEVMVTELRKCGIDAYELDTGLAITGRSLNDWQQERRNTGLVMIDCHDDHRIAMSFSILAARVEGITIEDKRCVDKTYPEYWDHLEQYLHFKTAPHPPPSSSLSSSSLAAPTALEQNGVHSAETSSSGLRILPSVSAASHPTTIAALSTSIIIIGMRGAGKTTLGQYLATALSRTFIDIDTEIEKQLKQPIRQYVEQAGWEAFRSLEWSVFKQVLHQDTGNAVISCGGGIVEIPAARELLQSYSRTTDSSFLTIFLHRHIQDIITYLEADATRPSFDAAAAYQRRLAWYRSCSAYEFVIAQGDTQWSSIEGEFFSFTQRSLLQQPIQISSRGGDGESFFLSLTMPDVEVVLDELVQMCVGVDAVELRVDFLASYDVDYIAKQIVLLRRALGSRFPIIFAVRTQSQGGRFPNDAAAAVSLLTTALRYNVDVVDIEVCWDDAYIREFLQHKPRHVLLIASYHCVGNNGGSNDEIRSLYERCHMNGYADIVKVVVTAKTTADAIRFLHITNTVTLTPSRPMIALAMGGAGRITRVFNTYLTPVTHPLLPTPAAPGQMSVVDLMKARVCLGLCHKKNFYVFGTPITHSPSPLLHNTAFQFYALPYHYGKIETNDIEQVRRVVQQPDFGGASVTIPLKEQVYVLCTEMSTAARQIGAVNTLYKQEEDGSIYGDNTDWIGIYRLLQQQQQPASSSASQQVVSSHDCVIIIGAGGTARAAIYACQQSGFQQHQLYLYNPRTPSKAQSLAAEFHATAIKTHTLSLNDLRQYDQDIHIRLIISTLPAAAVQQSEFLLDESLYSLAEKPIFLDVCYLPPQTILMKQARQLGCTQVIRGLDMLIEQGLAQFELWTGKNPERVRNVVEAEVRAAYRKQWEA